jgi:hypothetical protein
MISAFPSGNRHPQGIAEIAAAAVFPQDEFFRLVDAI